MWCQSIFGGKEPVVQLLLDKGAELNATTTNGRTALHIASERGRASVVRLLREAGAV
jgi:ankyrin repeat protein